MSASDLSKKKQVDIPAFTKMELGKLLLLDGIRMSTGSSFCTTGYTFEKVRCQRIARMEAEIAPASLARGSENPRTFLIDILDFIIRDFR